MVPQRRRHRERAGAVGATPALPSFSFQQRATQASPLRTPPAPALAHLLDRLIRVLVLLDLLHVLDPRLVQLRRKVLKAACVSALSPMTCLTSPTARRVRIFMVLLRHDSAPSSS